MKPWLWLPPKLAHDLSPLFLRVFSRFPPQGPTHWRPSQWRGLNFPNPLGLAGGVDKAGTSVESWWRLGAGFVEVGTVTPEPQAPNPGKIIDRHPESLALWNRMGFPSHGARRVLENLQELSRPYRTPLFVNIGRNRNTPNAQATQDYLNCMQILRPVADAFVVNISSPNTKGLRELQGADYLRQFLKPIATAQKHLEAPIPLLLKLSPDMSQDDLKAALETTLELDFGGWILTNTTTARGASTSHFPSEGGVSGGPLAELAKSTLQLVVKTLGHHRQGRLLVSAGGVLSAEDVFERLEMGADLVQVYAALIYSGPYFFRSVARHARSHPLQLTT